MTEKKKNEMCGIIMPISSIDGCNEQHWKDVKSILSEAIENAGFESNLVSLSDDVGVIQKRIVQNIYDNPIIVCDVSGKNSNVMFELGMRLAFDKATIVIKDDKTSYSFDTSPIEHLTYPRDLRFNRIVEFKKELTEKIKATYEKSKSDPNYSTFLKHFGKFTVTKLDTTEVSKEDFIIEEIKELRYMMSNMNRRDKDIRYRSKITSSLFDEENKEHELVCYEKLMPEIIKNIELVKLKFGDINSKKARTIIERAVLTGDNLPDCWKNDSDSCSSMLRDLIDKAMNNYAQHAV
jgi:hypothetical protein